MLTILPTLLSIAPGWRTTLDDLRLTFLLMRMLTVL